MSSGNALIRKFPMEPMRGFYVGRSRFLLGFVGPEMVCASVDLYHGSPLLAVSENSLWRGSPFPSTLVQNIRGVRGCAKIVPMVLCAVAITVVNLRRIFAGLHLPDNSMDHPAGSQEAYAPVSAIWRYGIRALHKVFGVPANPDAFISEVAARADFPKERASFSVIPKAFAEVCLRW